MNVMLSVGRASIHKSQLIHLTYKPKDLLKKQYSWEKGLTYDSGGFILNKQLSSIVELDVNQVVVQCSDCLAIAKLDFQYEFS